MSSALTSGLWHERSTALTHQHAVELLPLTQTARTRFASTAPFPLALTATRGNASEKARGNSRDKPSTKAGIKAGIKAGNKVSNKADNNAGGDPREFEFDWSGLCA